MLDNPRITQLEAVERINATLAELRKSGDPEVLDPACPEAVSKSAVNRYDLQMRDVGERLRQSREVADRWINKLGAAPQGQVGNLINEILRTLSFDVTLFMQEDAIDKETAPAVVGMLKDLALTTMRLEKAANLNVEREREIRKQTLEDAAEKVGDAAIQRGLTKEDAQFWREQVLGIR
ncbi:phage protein Gp27 family protein [Desulfuromonas sp. TF]|uniref:phage protein Gp27 family protein n=1 Tax=Desulfuromonas sp. TF TaxID=1232410 RepID=UPI00350F7FEF